MTGENTKYTCPDCGGALARIKDDGPRQYRCRIGHLYSPQSALAAHRERQENILWSAVVILEEGAELADEVRVQTREKAEQAALAEEARTKRDLAEKIRAVCLELPRASEEELGENIR